MKNSGYASIELFAGCGGLSLGLHNAGWQGLFAIEKDPMAFESLFHNMIGGSAPYKAFPGWPDWFPKSATNIEAVLESEDIRNRLHALRGTVRLIAGGPPCQGFSVGGRRDGADERNKLVYKMLEFVSCVLPDVVLIENVEGIARRFVSKPGEAATSVSDDVVQRLGDMGYESALEVVEATAFGVPQSRRRVIIVAFNRHLARGADIETLMSEALRVSARDVRRKYGLPVDRFISVGEAIGDLAGGARVICPDSPKFNSGTYTEPKSAYARLMRRGIADREVPNSHRFSKHGEGINKLYELAHKTQKPGRLPKSFLLENGTKKDKKVLLDKEEVVSTITTHPDEYIHYEEPRNITVREMARLQSFPDDFHFHGRYTINGPRRRFDVARCSQVGNAVPPLMAEGIGLAIKTVLSGLECKDVDELEPMADHA